MDNLKSNTVDKLLYLPIEIVERELDAKLLLAAEAITRGYSVVIGNYWAVLATAKKWGGGVFIHKDMIDQREDTFWKPLKKNNVTLCVLDEEGLVFPNIDYYIRSRIGEGRSFAYLDKVFTWGNRQRDRLRMLKGADALNVITTGNPRLDLLRFPYLKIFGESSQIESTLKSGFVLVNTNFGPGNYSPYFKMSYYDHMKSLGRVTTVDEQVYYQERVAYYAGLFGHYKTLVAEMAEQLYPTNIIIRPHPVEDHDAWREAFKNQKNVKVVYTGSVLEWIAASSCVIHTGCTTGLEAFVMGKPVLRFNPGLRLDMESPLPNSLGPCFTSRGELISNVKSMLAGEVSWIPDSQQICALKEWADNIEGDFSYLSIMDEIDNLKISPSHVLPGSAWSRAFLNPVIDVVQGMNRYIGNNFADSSLRKFSILRGRIQRYQRYSGLPFKKVQDRFGRLWKERGATGQPTIRRISPDAYFVHSAKAM